MTQTKIIIICKMKFVLSLIAALLLFAETTAVSSEEDVEYVTYVGAVLEYEPYNIWSEEEKGLKVITTNAQHIIKYAEQAKAQHADILIAPEYGIQSLEMEKNNVSRFLTFTQYVPDPSDDIIPCSLPNDTSRIDAVRMLSCAAANLNMYLVIDLAEITPCNKTVFPDEIIYWTPDDYESCPTEGYYAYNCQVVFDRDGKVIARYRKQHLFLEDCFTPGPRDNSIAVFTTDFDVAFSLNICFDIVYEGPAYYNVKYAGIKDVAMSTAWVDELPFHLADGVQNAFSRGLECNLLVSGYHLPSRSKMGSGIYRNYLGDLPNYVYEKDSGNVLLVSTVTTRAYSSTITHKAKKTMEVPESNEMVEPQEINIGSIGEPQGVESVISFTGSVHNHHTVLDLNMENFNMSFLKPLNPGEVGNMSLCSADYFCCDMTYEYTGDLNYAFTVFSGRFTEGGGVYELGLQVCSIMYCKDNTFSSCGKIEKGEEVSDYFGPFSITSTRFSSIDVYPAALQRDYLLINNNDLKYERTIPQYNLWTEIPLKDFLVSALYGRWYANDP